MNVILINELELEVESYNKNTYLTEGRIESNASCTVITNDMTTLNDYMEQVITSLKIKHDGEVIYDLHDINAHISSINEYLNGDRMSISVNLTFDNE